MPKTITVYGLRANLRQVLDELAATQEPVILATRPQAGGSARDLRCLAGSASRASRRRGTSLAAAHAQVAQLTAELAGPERTSRPRAAAAGSRRGGHRLGHDKGLSLGPNWGLSSR